MLSFIGRQFVIPATTRKYPLLALETSPDHEHAYVIDVRHRRIKQETQTVGGLLKRALRNEAEINNFQGMQLIHKSKRLVKLIGLWVVS